MMRKDGSTNFAKGESHAQWNFVFLSFLFFSKACQVYYLSMKVASKRDLTRSLPPRSLPPPSKLYISQPLFSHFYDFGPAFSAFSSSSFFFSPPTTSVTKLLLV